MQIDFEALRAPFKESEIEWRIGQSGIAKSGKPWATCLAYLTSRAVMDRLDEVVGPQNWRDEYEKIEIVSNKGEVETGFICRLSLCVDGEWITKVDGAQTTNFEAFKGGLSDALKRAAVKWGIGRYLYDLEAAFAVIHEQRAPGAQKVKIDGKYFFWSAPGLPEWAKAA